MSTRSLTLLTVMPTPSAVTTRSSLAATAATAAVSSTAFWVATANLSTFLLCSPSRTSAPTRLPAALETPTVSSTSPAPTSTSKCNPWLYRKGAIRIGWATGRCSHLNIGPFQQWNCWRS